MQGGVQILSSCCRAPQGAGHRGQVLTELGSASSVPITLLSEDMAARIASMEPQVGTAKRSGQLLLSSSPGGPNLAKIQPIIGAFYTDVILNLESCNSVVSLDRALGQVAFLDWDVPTRWLSRDTGAAQGVVKSCEPT